MSIIRLGRTDLQLEKNAFGALPIQRISQADAVHLLRKAQDGGIVYFDSARSYTDSEEKVGAAFAGMRDKVVLATKTQSSNTEDFWQHLHTSLTNLRTDCIDVYQFHNPSVCYRPGDGTGMYEAMLEARQQGKIRFIGMTNHSYAIASEAAESGLYDTLQFPFSYLAIERDQQLVRRCEELDVGFVCMKGMSGGLIQNSRAAYAFVAQFAGALPIWGMQRESELDEFLSYINNPPVLDDALRAAIEKDRSELCGKFCRGCGYCLPCPAGINIPTAARIDLLIRRSALGRFRDEASQQMMNKVEDCMNCRHCADHCPYHLDTPQLLRDNLAAYRRYLA